MTTTKTKFGAIKVSSSKTSSGQHIIHVDLEDFTLREGGRDVVRQLAGNYDGIAALTFPSDKRYSLLLEAGFDDSAVNSFKELVKQQYVNELQSTSNTQAKNCYAGHSVAAKRYVTNRL